LDTRQVPCEFAQLKLLLVQPFIYHEQHGHLDLFPVTSVLVLGVLGLLQRSNSFIEFTVRLLELRRRHLLAVLRHLRHSLRDQVCRLLLRDHAFGLRHQG